MAYQVVHYLRLEYPEFQVVRHEDLPRHPVEGFRQLFAAIDLHFSPRAESIIRGYSSSENPKELSASSVHAYRLDSRANLNNWKRHLSAADILRVRQVAGEVAACYYPEESWD